MTQSAAIEDFDKLWRHTLFSQCNSLRASCQTWTYDPVRSRLAIIIEPRTNHPFLEPVVRNMMHALKGQDWNLLMITHDAEKAKTLFPGCDMQVRQVPFENLDEQQYSSILMTRDFWQSLPAEHVLIFQTDVVMLRPLDLNFLQYDYAGANVFVRQFVSPRVGAMNGGFSLRKRSAMLECIQKVPVGRVCAALKAPPNAYIPEDIYFTHACEMLGLSMPPIPERKHLAIEAEYYESPCAFHGFQHTYYYFSLDDCHRLISKSPFLSPFTQPALGSLPPVTWVFHPSDYAVVVARYKEDVSWVPAAYDPEHVIIYNKGPSLPSPLTSSSAPSSSTSPPSSRNYTVVNLPNVGRESHTYLIYIIQHYDRLPEIVHFTQAGTTDHQDRMTCSFTDLGDSAYSQNTTVSSFTKGLTPDGYIGNYLGQNTSPSAESGPAWFARYVDDSVDLEQDIHIWYAGIFSVRRERILSRPRLFYERLLQQLDHHPNPEVGHFMERSWFYIFQCHK